MMKVVVTTGATRCAKLQSNRHHQQTRPICPSLSPNQQYTRSSADADNRLDAFAITGAPVNTTVTYNEAIFVTEH